MGLLLIVKLLPVFGLGAIELWAAIPTGFVLRLHPVVTGIVAATGGILGALIVAVLGKRVREWLMRWHGGGKKEGAHGRLHRLWTHYGAAGLGLLAPLLVGAPLGTALGITLGAKAGRLLAWMCLGIVFWSALLTVAGTLGLTAMESLKH